MSEGVVLFVITVILGIPLSVAIGFFVNDLQQRRDFGAFSVRKKSPARIRQEYERAKRLRDDPRLLGLNVATWLVLSVETLIFYAIFILIGIFFIVFLNAYADVAPLVTAHDS